MFRQGREARRGERKEKREAEDGKSEEVGEGDGNSEDLEKIEEDGNGLTDEIEVPEK